MPLDSPVAKPRLLGGFNSDGQYLGDTRKENPRENGMD
jgi:hypothetical protein